MKPLNCILRTVPPRNPTVARLKAIPQAETHATMPTREGIFASLDKAYSRSAHLGKR